MSIRVLSLVWEYSQHKGSELLLLLSIADYASDGGYAFPGIESLAEKTRLSTRQVMRLIKQIEKSGELIVLREHKKVNKYIINIQSPDWVVCKECGKREIIEVGGPFHNHHIVPKSQGGKDNPENLILLCPPCHRHIHKLLRIESDNLSPNDLPETSPKIAENVAQRVTPVSPESSINHKLNHHKEDKESITPFKEMQSLLEDTAGVTPVNSRDAETIDKFVIAGVTEEDIKSALKYRNDNGASPPASVAALYKGVMWCNGQRIKEERALKGDRKKSGLSRKSMDAVNLYNDGKITLAEYQEMVR